METNINHQEIFDSYLKGKLSDMEKLDFEKQLISNPDISKEFGLHKMINEEIVERAGFFQIMDNAEKKKKGRSYQLVYYSISIAASLIILITLLQPGKMSNSEILDEYAIPFEIQILNGTSETRSIEWLEYKSYSKDELITINEALSLYTEGEFGEAASKFENAITSLSDDVELSLLMAYSQFRSGQLNEAYANFNYLKNTPDKELAQKAYFYLALISIQNGNKREARKILKDIQYSDGAFSNQANQILKKMRWF